MIQEKTAASWLCESAHIVASGRAKVQDDPRHLQLKGSQVERDVNDRNLQPDTLGKVVTAHIPKWRSMD